MRTSDVDILIVPGPADGGAGHWYARWDARLPTARQVGPAPEGQPVLAGWSSRLVAAVAAASRPVVLVAHDLGVLVVAEAAGKFAGHEIAGHEIAGKVAGAFLVAAPSASFLRSSASLDPAFAALTLSPMPFPSVLVASRDDPSAGWAASEALAKGWGAELVDAGASGHLDEASGFGPWPEGLMRFAGFLKSLPAPLQASS